MIALPQSLVAFLVAAPIQGAPPAAGQGGGAPSSAVVEEGDSYVLNFDETQEGSVSLLEFIKLCEEATGINFTHGEEARQELETKKVRIFGVKRIPKEDFYSFFQIVMFINNFICTRVGPEPLAIVVVQPISGPGGRPSTKLGSEAVYVLPEELDQYADQVATPITTVLHLPNVDVRQLGNSLRTLSPDATMMQAIPLADTSSIILQGFASNIVSLARLLEIVDRESAIDDDIVPTFEVIPLEFAAAEDVADVLEQLLEASRNQLNRQVQQPVAGATGAMRQGVGEVRILTYPRTNSLLVMALPDDMKNVKELVARLDVDVVEPERYYNIYSVANVQAEELVEVLEDFLQEASRVDLTAGAGQARPQQGPQGGGGTRRQTDVVVVADPVSNAILLAANKTRYQEMIDLIRKLDQRQDQVLIETALIELSGTDTFDLGVELGVADIPSGGGTGSFGLTDFGLSTLVDSDMDGVLDSRIPNQGSSIVAGILSGSNFNLPFLLAAAETRTDTNVLQIPSVLVTNNGSAEVRSTDEQPTTTNTLSATGASQQNFSGFEEAGTTLRISPSISAAGYLRLDVYLEVANFVGSGSGNVPAPRTRRSVQTQVNVPDGDTMVVGGIVTDNSNDTRRQVPFLGDIPLLGKLFGRDTKNLQRTTLYFFVTPHILEDRDFADLSEISYARKLDAADRIGSTRLRLIDPDFRLPVGEVDLQGFQVPLYRSPGSGEVAPDRVGLDDPARRQELLDPLDEAEEDREFIDPDQD